jgi:hypothetical protein
MQIIENKLNKPCPTHFVCMGINEYTDSNPVEKNT